MTTKTTKIAEAISILSEILSAEVATENHPFDNTEEYVEIDTYDALNEASSDYQTQAESSLEEIQMTLQDVAADVLDDDDDESWIVPAWVDVADEEPDTSSATDSPSKDGDEPDTKESEALSLTAEEALSVAKEFIDGLEVQIEEYKSAFRVLNNTVTEALEENNTFREALLLEEM